MFVSIGTKWLSRKSAGFALRISSSFFGKV